MSEHMLSQDEIDALLRGEDAGDSAASSLDSEAVSRLFQAALEHIAPLAPPIAGKPLETGPVTAELLPWGELRTQLLSPLVAVWRYDGAFQGIQLSIADSSSRQQLRAYGSDNDPVTLLNKLALALAQGLEQVLGSQLQPDIASYQDMSVDGTGAVPLQDDDDCIVLHMNLRGEEGDLSWLEVLPVDVAAAMTGASTDATTGAAPSAVEVSTTERTTGTSAAAEMPAARSESRAVSVAPAEFAPLAPTPAVPEPANIGLIMDVPLHVTVELGRRRMLVRDVLDLGKGSLIELDKLAGEPVDVFVNGKLIAKGEVVVIDENFGVKVTSIVNPAERMRNLQ